MQSLARPSFRRLSPIKAPALRTYCEILQVPQPLRSPQSVAPLFTFIKRSNFFCKLIEEVSEEVAMQCCLVMTYESCREGQVESM